MRDMDVNLRGDGASRLRPGLLTLVLTLFASAGGNLSAQTAACAPPDGLAQSFWAVGDFDGNQSADLARVTIRWHRESMVSSGVDLFALCPGSLPALMGAFPPRGLTLSVRDVDRDNDQDLILREAFAGRALGVWLNDGTGAFSASEPSRDRAASEHNSVLQRPNFLDRELTVSTASKVYLTGPPRGGFILLIPGSRRAGPEPATPATADRRDDHQSRAPPFLSY
jgi:hypothetical protein